MALSAGARRVAYRHPPVAGVAVAGRSRLAPLPRRIRSGNNASGFTLIELLIALVVFALMAAMAYGGLASVLRTRTAVASALERTAELQKAVFRLQSDLEQVRRRPVRDNYGDAQPDFFLDPNDGRLLFTRGGHDNPLLFPRSTLQRVAYAREDDKLVRYSWDVLDRAQDSAPARIVLAEGIEHLAWRFLDRQHHWSETPLPRDATAGELTPVLPLAVQLTLDTRDWGRLRLLFLVGH